MKCKICNKEFKMITGKHLRKHNISASEYKLKYGPLVSEEYSQRISERVSGKNNPNFGKKHTPEVKDRISKANTGRIAHNKGVHMTAEQKELLSKKAIDRNKKWRENGNHPNIGSKRTAKTKAKIKKARERQIITTESVMKAIQTKKDRGYDLAFFRGKKHTLESKKLIAKKSIESNKKRTLQARIDTISRMKAYGFNINDINGNYMSVQCMQCSTEFSRTYQYATKSKINYEMCPVCHPPLGGTSKAEKEIALFLEQYTTVKRNSRSIISPQELDIYLPEFNIAIEYNGLYWHNELRKDKNYHITKTNECLEKDIQLIHVFEDEYMNNPDIVKSRLLFMIGQNNTTIYARKCKVVAITPKEANSFIKQNHIQGVGRANIHLGLYYEDDLVSVMTFLNGDISKNTNGWELNRFCSKLNTSVIGAGGKLFKYFIKMYAPTAVTTFSDRRWSKTTPFYEKIGFKLVDQTTPNYWYIPPGTTTRIHRYALRKPEKCAVSERELRESEGYLRIYDCGSSKYVWKK